jgi:Arc/MetJ-type ribon-helix-helix transcriptional regulator
MSKKEKHLGIRISEELAQKIEDYVVEKVFENKSLIYKRNFSEIVRELIIDFLENEKNEVRQKVERTEEIKQTMEWLETE